MDIIIPEYGRTGELNSDLGYLISRPVPAEKMKKVAEDSNMIIPYFSVLFKEKMGESYIKYVTKTRIEHAKRLLKKGAKVNEVNEKVGYYNYRHFFGVIQKTYWNDTRSLSR